MNSSLPTLAALCTAGREPTRLNQARSEEKRQEFEDARRQAVF
ncbi:MAG: hypothetical protein QGG84_03220 [Rhodospirillales bacterium]|nr:hypothetical protein [Rhodospirillales bacterium]